MNAAHRVGGIVLLAGAIGCGTLTDDTPQSAAFTVRDSAGIEIVEIDALALRSLVEWEVAPTPILEIGSVGASSGEALFGVNGLFRRADSGVVVANSGTQEVLSFDGNGELEWRAGGEGEGPGEFRRLAGMHHVHGQGIGVVDSQARRLSWFGLDGTLQQTVPLDQGEYVPLSLVLGVLPDGRVGVAASERAPPGERAGRTVYLVDGGGPQPIVEAPPLLGRSAVMFSSLSRLVFLPLVPKLETFQLSEDRVAYSHSERGTIEFASLEGELVRSIRWTGNGEVLTDAFGDSLVSQLMTDVPESERAGFEEAVRPGLVPGAPIPVFTTFGIGTDGSIWVRAYRRGEPNFLSPPWSTGPPGPASTLFWVLAPDGRPLAQVRTPTGFELFEVGLDYLLGVWRDEFDVEYVRTYRLSRAVGDLRSE